MELEEQERAKTEAKTEKKHKEKDKARDKGKDQLDEDKKHKNTRK